MPRELLNLELRNPLPYAIDTGRSNRLVCRYHHQPVGTEFICQSGYGSGAYDVVYNHFFGIRFNQVHVLVGSRMKNNTRTIFFEKGAHSIRVPDICDNGTHLEIRKPVSAFSVDLPDALLASPQEQQFRGTESADLPAQFRPDRTASPRNQYGLTGDICCDPIEIPFDLIAPEQIMKLEVRHFSIKCGDPLRIGRGSISDAGLRIENRDLIKGNHLKESQVESERFK